MSDNNKASIEREPVIADIVASAGGVQALQPLFNAVPDGTGASFVVIVHLDQALCECERKPQLISKSAD